MNDAQWKYALARYCVACQRPVDEIVVNDLCAFHRANQLPKIPVARPARIGVSVPASYPGFIDTECPDYQYWNDLGHESVAPGHGDR
jgi:hypothetical protein